MYGHGHDTDDDESMPSLEEIDPHSVLRDHNPFRAADDDDDDPEEADISQMPQFQNTRMQNTGPGRYHFSATIHQTIPLPGPASGQNGNGPNTIGGITSFLSNLISNAGMMRPQGQAEAGDGQGGSAPRAGPEGGDPHVRRFTYSSGARLHPRDGDNPGPRLEPVDGLNK
jgi:E3 ubiquitin-protein ligase RNF115/126